MADAAPPADAPPAEGEAPPAEAPAEAPAEPPAPTGPPKTWKASDKPQLWKFPPADKIVKIEIDEETKLSKDQLKIMRDAFRIFDSEHKGAIPCDMVKEILTLLGHEVNDDELDEVMEEFDEDESGEIEFREFIKLAEEFIEPEEDYETAKNNLRELFCMYDKEERGFIPVADFVTILKAMEPELSDEEANQIVKELDADGSGTIEFEEFIDAMLGEEDEDPRNARHH